MTAHAWAATDGYRVVVSLIAGTACVTIADLDIGGTPRPLAIDPDAPLLMSLSSGTTGRPKGPMLTHRQMTLRSLSQWVSIGFNEHDRNMVATPMYFGGGRGFTLSFLMIGGTSVLTHNTSLERKRER